MSASPPETRASLILRLPNADDVAAWEEFVAVYGQVIFRVARRHGLQSSDADDLVQEVLTAVARSVERWLQRSDRGSFRAWLLRIARNTAVNQLTRRATRPLGSLADEAERVPDSAAAADQNLSGEFDLEYRREVFQWAARQVRDQVAETTWQAFWLTQVQGLTIAAAARQLNISVGNIYIARSRVMTRLRDKVRQFDDPEV